MLATLLTDFGDMDGFVGAMRGVMIARAPGIRLVDLAHHVPRGDVAKAARVLDRAAPHFPTGTVHCVVVDPGVGSARRAVVVRSGGQTFVAPDNGVLTDILRTLGPPDTAREITHPALQRRTMSSTFHGRDLFAPAAAAFAAGFPIQDAGASINDLVALPFAEPRITDGAVHGRVIEVDRFGNLMTDLTPESVASDRLEVAIGGVRLLGPASSYAAVPSGALVLVIGSLGTLEVAVRDGSAAARLKLGAGAACVARSDRAQSAS